MAVTSFAPAAAGFQQYEQVFTSSGTWTKPASVKTAEVTILGGGGCTMSGQSGAGGAGGYYKGIVDVSTASTVSVTVGAGASFNTARGGDSAFGNLILARGGYSWSASSNNSSGEVLFPTATGTKNVLLRATHNNTTFYSTSGYTPTPSRVAFGNNIYVFAPGWNNTQSYYTSQYRTSTDGFQTSTVRNFPESSYMWTVFFINGYFWLFNYNGFWKSTDGINWGDKTSYVGFNAEAGTFAGIVYANGWFVYTNGTNTVRRSQDGINWSTTVPAFSVYFPKVANNVIFAMNKDQNTNNVQYSSDGGATWKQFSTNWYYPEDVTYFNGYYHIEHHWSQPYIVMATMDGSNNLSNYTYYSNGSYGGAVATDISTNTMYRLGDGTVYSSTDGFNWTQLATNMPSASTEYRKVELYALNGYIIGTRSDTTTQDVQSIQPAFGFYGFPGMGSNYAGGAVGPAQYIYSSSNYAAPWGSEPIANDPLLIGCGLGGYYAQTYNRYPLAVYQTTRYGSGGYAASNGNPTYAGGNGIVIVRWWA